jgi:hypothetical protein
MKESIAEVAAALKTLNRPDPFGPEIKASDDFLGPVFERYFGKLGLRNLMRKTDYHALARFVPHEKIDPDIIGKLDQIAEVASRAKPVA